MNDEVWVKVLEINREERDGRMYTKIRLSLKDAAQDGSAKDLGQERVSSEAMKDQIAQNLNSTIGMGVAMDPMSKKSHLILKSDASRAATVINGYELVGDDEGEPPKPEPPPVVKPMGRGRGNTLPAWMTRNDGPTGIKETEKKAEKQKRKEAKRERKEERKRRKHDRKREHGERRERRKHSRRRSDDSDGDRRRRKRPRGNERGSRSREKGARESDQSVSSDSSRSDHCERRQRSSEKDRRHERSSDSDSDRSQYDNDFTSLDEAKRLIARLEAEKKRKEA